MLGLEGAREHVWTSAGGQVWADGRVDGCVCLRVCVRACVRACVGGWLYKYMQGVSSEGVWVGRWVYT